MNPSGFYVDPLYYIDVAFVWLGGIMLWLWYWFGVQPSYMG